MKNLNYKKIGGFALGGAVLGFGIGHFAKFSKKNKIMVAVGGLVLGGVIAYFMKGDDAEPVVISSTIPQPKTMDGANMPSPSEMSDVPFIKSNDLSNQLPNSSANEV